MKILAKEEEEAEMKLKLESQARKEKEEANGDLPNKERKEKKSHKKHHKKDKKAGNGDLSTPSENITLSELNGKVSELSGGSSLPASENAGDPNAVSKDKFPEKPGELISHWCLNDYDINRQGNLNYLDYRTL